MANFSIFLPHYSTLFPIKSIVYIYVLTELAEKFPAVLPEAIQAIKKLPNEEKGSFVESLTKITRNFPQALPETIEIVRAISERAEDRIRLVLFLTDLVEVCPQLLPEALREIQKINDERECFEITLSIAKDWNRSGARLPLHLYLYLNIQSYPEKLSFAKLVGCLNSIQGKIQKFSLSIKNPKYLIEAIHKIDEQWKDNPIEQANALAELVENLPDKLLAEAVSAIMSTIMVKSDTLVFYEIPLVAIARRSPELLPKALDSIYLIDDKLSKYKAILLSRLAEKFPHVAIQALDLINIVQQREGYDIDFLTQDKIAESLMVMVQNLPDDLVFKFFESVQALKNDKLRSNVLQALVPRLAKLERKETLFIWQEILRTSCRRTRPYLLKDLATLIPVISTLGGKEALASLQLEISAITRCYP